MLAIFVYEYRRWREKNEREKVGIREHIRLLRAKMDKFYSPLFGNLTIFHVGDRERTKMESIDPFMRKYLIRDKYPTMASERLSELLDRYFRMGEIDIRREHGKPDDKWKALLDEIRETIQVDFEKLQKDIARAREISRDTAIEGKFV
ncbi:hypothetical protein ES702_05323 [subsurface metagenome]